MDYFIAIIMGIVEGITEFLPISSTAHLIITSKFLKVPQSEFLKFFEVFIQSGAILAVIFMYFNYARKNLEIMKKVALSFIPTAIVGFLLHKIIKEVFFESYGLIIASLMVIGLVFILVEYLIAKKKIKLGKSLRDLTLSDSLIIGLGQSLAVVPGVSRAGVVMLFMMVKGYRRDESAIYSFLLAVPTILAASGYDLLKTDLGVITDSNNLVFLLVGFVTSFVTAYVSVKWLIGYLKRKTLVGFGIYRVILSLTLFVV
jgi:undecaprenyl-diphosphatase